MSPDFPKQCSIFKTTFWRVGFDPMQVNSIQLFLSHITWPLGNDRTVTHTCIYLYTYTVYIYIHTMNTNNEMNNVYTVMLLMINLRPHYIHIVYTVCNVPYAVSYLYRQYSLHSHFISHGVRLHAQCWETLTNTRTLGCLVLMVKGFHTERERHRESENQIQTAALKKTLFKENTTAKQFASTQ